MVTANCFISEYTKFCLIDGDRVIRATSNSLQGIFKNKLERGWGKIFRMNFNRSSGTLTLGELIE